uniref:Integrase, catalytic region n=1 Tax=Magnetococcus massalia (strain MO-1) TaxID=451514 RepID=A0A1S7LC16_MAGMO
MEVRLLIKRLREENPLWGAPRIHGELLKLGYDYAQSTIANYLPKPNKTPSQTWNTFLHNHRHQMVAMDFFTVPTLFFKILHVLILVDHQRRRVVYFNVTTNPTSAWVAQQIRQAFPWESAPRYLLHDRDPLFAGDCRAALYAMGTFSVITAPGRPWQNAICERLIGTLRRECLDHMIVLCEEHLRKILGEYLLYYHGSRTHMSLSKDCPNPRPMQVQQSGRIKSTPFLGGLHHRYERQAA